MESAMDIIKRAAADPRRPGMKCQAEPGLYRPEVNVRRCEGKGACVVVCPYKVFEVGRISDEAFRRLPPLFKLRSWAHGKKTANIPRADACRACGLCVVACPERAIRLVGPEENTVAGNGQ